MESHLSACTFWRLSIQPYKTESLVAGQLKNLPQLILITIKRNVLLHSVTHVCHHENYLAKMLRSELSLPVCRPGTSGVAWHCKFRHEIFDEKATPKL